jgi:hypothetical protein
MSGNGKGAADWRAGVALAQTTQQLQLQATGTSLNPPALSMVKVGHLT